LGNHINESNKSYYRKQEGSTQPKSTLSKEEKLRKAKELQEAIRKKRAEEEKRL